MCEICSKLITKIPEKHLNDIYILVFLLLTLSRIHTIYSGASNDNFEQVYVSWVHALTENTCNNVHQRLL